MGGREALAKRKMRKNREKELTEKMKKTNTGTTLA